MSACRPSRTRRGFTLIELLVVVAVIALLISILLPALSSARAEARGAKCLGQLRVLGTGLTMYTNSHGDVLVPGRLPKIDNCNWYGDIAGGRKFRPNFLAMMSSNVGAPPFDNPAACANMTDIYGEKGDRQNYTSPAYVCPEVPDWTDERNCSYGYNYQFLGNSRLLDESDMFSFKRWPVKTTWIRYPSRTVAVADCMGTAASYAAADRLPYENNARESAGFGNEGFNLDPPRVDPVNGEMAGIDTTPQTRTAADPRHRGRSKVLFVDAHAESRTVLELGYRLEADGSFAFDGDNALWSGNGEDVAWTPAFRR